MRDQHRNVLPIGTAPTYDVELRLYDTARKRTFPRREILALEFFGVPEPYRCIVCDKALPYTVVHLNKDLRDFSRDNLKYTIGFGREHELDCLQWAMTSNYVPRRKFTISRRVGAIEAEKDLRDEQ